jgi:hypothetical protein
LGDSYRSQALVADRQSWCCTSKQMTTFDPTTWQNPLYPQDAGLTSDQIAAKMRTISMQRAQSPAPRLCLLPHAPPVYYDPKHDQTHVYQEYMSYRFNHVIGNEDPWSNWSLYDMYPFPPQPTVPPPPPGPVINDWYPLARVNPHGISVMTGMNSDFSNMTVAVMIGASMFNPYGPGTETRITIMGQCTVGGANIGPATNTPFVAKQLFPLTFNGGSPSGVTGPAFTDWSLVSDPLLQAIDASNGVIVSYWISGPDPRYPAPTYTWAAFLQSRVSEPNWQSRWRGGNHLTDLDKSKLNPPDDLYNWTRGWFQSPNATDGLLMIEGFYPTVVTQHRARHRGSIVIKQAPLRMPSLAVMRP